MLKVRQHPLQSLLWLYPPHWRERYGDEFAALLEHCSPSPAVVFDVLRGALDARLQQSVGTRRLSAMVNRLRSSEIAVFCAFIAFVMAGIGFQKMAEEPAKSGIMRTYATLGIAFDVVIAGAVIALLAVLAGGVPLALAALRYALARRRRDIPLLLAVPPLALIAWVGYVVILNVSMHPGTRTSFRDSGGIAILISVASLFIVAAVGSTAAVSAAIARSEIDERLVRFAFWPAVVTTVAMAAVSLSVIVWGLGLAATAPRFFSIDGGALISYGTFTWLRVVLIMGLATLVAVASLLRGAPPRHNAA